MNKTIAFCVLGVFFFFGQWPKLGGVTWTFLRFFFLLDAEKIMLSLEFGDERDLGKSSSLLGECP